MQTILVVDDIKTNISIIVDLLGEDYDILVALDGKTAFELLEVEEIDLILLDIMMPVLNGYEVCKILKKNTQTKDIPVIFLTAKTDEDSIEKAYDVGGIDYVVKPFKPKELCARVKTQLQLVNLINDLKNSKEELKVLASTDSMTGLHNRRYFVNVSEHIFEIAKRENQSLSVLMLDIDKFKNINDTFGHHIGDYVIKELAIGLKKLMRSSDVVCRFGGEEFVILLVDTLFTDALAISEKIRKNIEQIVVSTDNKEIKFTVSIGISMVNTQKDIDIDSSIYRADLALYDAKNSGRNKVCSKL